MEKCITCGFLCKYAPGSNVPTPKFFEMDPDDRKSGQVFQHTIDTMRGPAYAHPACFRLVESVRAELEHVAHKPDKFLEVATRERQCSKWTSYEVGFSPQDHLQELKMNELEFKRQEFELKLFEMNRSLTEKAGQSNWHVTVVLILFAMIEVVFGAASVMQLAYPNGWPWLMRAVGSLPSPPTSLPGF